MRVRPHFLCTLLSDVNGQVYYKGSGGLLPEFVYPYPQSCVPHCHKKFAYYHKIPKISRRAYIFSKAFFEGLIFLEGPIFGWAYVWREICVSKSVGLACSGKVIYHFCFVLLCIQGQIPSTSPLWGLYSEGCFNGGFFALRFRGAYIWRGLYMDGLIFGFLRYFLVVPSII